MMETKSNRFIFSKKFCWLYCGGAASTDWGEKLRGSVDQSLLNAWVKRSPELTMLGTVEPKFFTESSGNTMPLTVVSEMAKFIAAHIDDYDGFLVTHDLDRIIFHAALLAFMLGGTPKPIIFTCSPAVYLNPEEAARAMKSDSPTAQSGLSSHLLQAMQSANIGFQEVALFFHQRAIRAMRAVANRQGLRVLDSLHFPSLGDLEFGLTAEGRMFHPPTHLKLRPRVDPRINISDTRWESPNNFRSRLNLKTTTGIFLFGHDNTPLSDTWLTLVHEPALRSLPIVVCSESSKDHPELQPVMQVRHEPLEVSMAKFFWILGQTSDRKLIQQVMEANLLGEKLSMEDLAKEGNHLQEQEHLSLEFREFLDIEL